MVFPILVKLSIIVRPQVAGQKLTRYCQKGAEGAYFNFEASLEESKGTNKPQAVTPIISTRLGGTGLGRRGEWLKFESVWALVLWPHQKV